VNKSPTKTAKTNNSVLDVLLNPIRRVVEGDRIQRSRLLSAILLIQVAALCLILYLVLNADPRDINEPTVKAALGLVAILTIMYVINRFGYSSIAALGYIFPFIAVFIYIPFYSGENPAFLAFLVIPILITAIFFSLRWTIIISLALLLLVGYLISLLDHSLDNLLYWNLRNMLYFLLLATALILTFMWHQKNLEQIRQSELVRNNDLLEKQVAELEQFTYTISHDLKGPIVTIRGFLGLLEHDIQENRLEQINKDFNRIREAAAKMQSLISDLLEFSKTGKILNSIEEIPLNDLIQGAIESRALLLKENNIDVINTNKIQIIYGDRARFIQVFEHLIDNAVKYMGEQSQPKIEIGSLKSKDDNILYFRDNGMGIDSAYHKKVFGLFEKLDALSDGTGIGLALIKRIIELHGCRIWVESDGLNKGSTFYFTIPTTNISK